MSSGKLIVVDGIDGAGTTTQARRLADALSATGYRVHRTREPSDGPIGRLIRQMLSRQHAPVDNATMALLFAADRADHCQREVLPALARGDLVISDRWYHSSLAYQGTDVGERDWVAELNRHIPAPALTVFLDVAPEIAAERRAAAGRNTELYDDIAVQRCVAEAYREAIAICRRFGETISCLDGSGTVDVTAEAIYLTVIGFLDAQGFEQ